MSYQVLARKWRPKDFSQLVGQEHVVTVLVNALMQQRLHHAYLFTGTRGVGKTTIARIFAKSLNCQQGITSTPCGTCDVCVDVDQGNFVDLLEIDAASRTKVDDTREILDNVQYAPTRGRFKVYLIDEVHMLSKSSFNALLKTLEEPPPHVKFILATTDPQKLPVTVLSRCLQFHLKALTPSQIEQKLTEILNAEDVTFDDGALSVLAKAARGSMRDSLSLTDQAIAQGQGHITTTNLQAMLGGVDQNWIYKILIALIKQDSKGLLELTQSIASFAPSYHRLLAELLQLLHQVALWQLVPNSVDVDVQRATLLTKFAQSMSPADVQLYYQIVLNGRKDLPYSFDEQAGFDMVILRLLAFKPVTAPDIKQADPVTESVNTEQQFSDIDLTTTPAVNKSNLPKVKNDTNASSLDATEKATTKDPLPVIVKNKDSAQQAIDTPARPAQMQRPTPTNDVSSLHAEQQQLEQLAQQQFAPIDSYQQDQFEPVSDDENLAFEPQIEPTETLQPRVDSPSVTPQSTETVMPNNDDSNSSSASTLDKMLATRNMLRSRKKLSEGKGKKPKGQVTNVTGASVHNTDKPKAIIPNLETNITAHQPTENQPTLTHKQASQTPLENQHSIQSDADLKPSVLEKHHAPEPVFIENFGNFNPDNIDPDHIRFAHQIDTWSQLIDAMDLGGRVRQLAFNATMDPQSSDSFLKINLNNNSAHINSQSALEQIKARYTNIKNQQVSVEIHLVEDPGYTPLVIQQIINEKRLINAQQIIHNDKFVNHLVQKFDANIFEDSIEPL